MTCPCCSQDAQQIQEAVNRPQGLAGIAGNVPGYLVCINPGPPSRSWDRMSLAKAMTIAALVCVGGNPLRGPETCPWVFPQNCPRGQGPGVRDQFLGSALVSRARFNF